jgi:membrane-bound inhibitor of C-type lysozyme
MMELTNLAMLLGMAAPDTAVSMQLVLELTGNAERKQVTYQCEGGEQPFTVDYINAEPNFLALIWVEGKQVIFTSVLAASGARYVSGPLEWWSKGDEATFADLRDNALPAVTCNEISNTP